MTGGVLSVLIIALFIAEYLGWPFLANPIQRTLSDVMHRPVMFSVPQTITNTKSTTQAAVISSANAQPSQPFKIHFLGGIRLEVEQLYIAAPTWSKSPHTLLANDVQLELRYIDLWRAYADKPLIIKRLQASILDANLERLKDGRASWRLRDKLSTEPLNIPMFDHLQVTKGLVNYQDIPLEIDVKAQLSLTNNPSLISNSPLKQSADLRTTTTIASNSDTIKNTNVLQASAAGFYKKLPLKIALKTSAVSPSTTNQTVNQTQALPLALTLNATIGRATLAFKGGIADALNFNHFAGRYNLKGPSLAAVGDLFSVTLPTTAVFVSNGSINKKDNIWKMQVNNLDIGASRLNGSFTYLAKQKKVDSTPPLLTGQLGGSKLLLTDLGPAFGAEPGLSKRKKVLPTRPFDLAALRKMDADVRVDIKHVDLNKRFLAPLQPLRGHLQLKSGVLTLKDLDARTADGKLAGDLSLDGRGLVALWDANLRWSGVKLERWVKQVRKDGTPPYVTGILNGRTTLKGQGVSTAEILATLRGNFRTELLKGSVSHLLIEVAGLDLAQTIGVFFKGDDVLPVQCGVIDLEAKAGVFTPRVMVVDTKDSAVWVDGSLSLASETLDLRAIVTPKDFSPLTLRSPLHVNGTFANPEVSLEKGPIGTKIAASFLLALVNPFAAIIPLLDSGDDKEALQHAASCQHLMQRVKNKPSTSEAVKPQADKSVAIKPKVIKPSVTNPTSTKPSYLNTR